jgi:hypothetical protein
MNYSKVQFISWELHTGPFVSGDKVGHYTGLRSDGVADDRTDALGQCNDIMARVAFTAGAIGAARGHVDTSPTTLKIFMAPEFLYRGAGGAYLHDLVNGWPTAAPGELGLTDPYKGKWGGLFGELQAVAANPDYENWLFVFGTAISASFPTAKTDGGKYILDPSKPGEIYNTALVQRGGAGHTANNFASRKHYISPIDFLNWYTSNGIQHVNGSILPLDPKSMIPADVMGEPEGGAVFTISGVNDSTGKPINLGIEVCLDHAESGGNSTNKWGRIRTANQYVKIQLVPSAGMSLEPASIRLEAGGYAFNCDGLGNVNPLAWGCHTQVWNGGNGGNVLPAN